MVSFVRQFMAAAVVLAAHHGAVVGIADEGHSARRSAERHSVGSLKGIAEIRVKIDPPAGGVPSHQSLPFHANAEVLRSSFVFGWESMTVCHHPLYFEEAKLERHGITASPLFQPILSGAHFYGNVLRWPGKLFREPPWLCVCPIDSHDPACRCHR